MARAGRCDTAGTEEQNRDLVIASNRLPVTISLTDEGFDLEPSSGGLAAAVRGVRERLAWIGWPGGVVPPELAPELEERLAANGLHPVMLDEAEEQAFYSRMCNDTLWPLFHYFVGRVQFDAEAWRCYVAVNERFAEAIARRAPHRGRVWIHDFHLMLVPEGLRRRRPDLSIGFFLHIPFPTSEVYRLLPARKEVLLGLLGADYIGFHTGDYASHFRSSCLRVLGLESEPDSIDHGGRIVGVGADPIGIDVARFRDVLADPETQRIYAELEERYRDRRLVLGVERLDYSKGIPQKLRAFERFLEQDPARAKTTTMLQVLVPSRLESAEYRAQRDEIALIIARINGRFGEPGRTPVEYLHRAVSPPELAALYRRADVMAVTPLRDGMNLVAQEFALCQWSRTRLPDRARGVLLLSEFAGAAQVLPGAMLVNPWDVDDLVARLVEALELSAAERHWRLGLMSGPVAGLECRRWAERSLDRLARATRRSRRLTIARPLDAASRERIRQRVVQAKARSFLLDYDGTLTEIVGHPSLARPSREVLELLAALAALPATDVHLISGRTGEQLEEWFGHLPVALCAEHGYRTRRPGEGWRTLKEVDLSWKPRIERLFRRVAEQVPGTLVERKTCSVAWHYRGAEPSYGAWRARELRVDIEQLLHGFPAEILTGHRVVEVRPRGVNKGTYVRSLFPSGKPRRHFVLSAGDDRTDADAYAALPSGSVAIHVGHTLPRALAVAARDRYVVSSPTAMRVLLRDLAAAVDEARA